MWKLIKTRNKTTGKVETKAVGHTGIVEKKLDGTKVDLWGAHKSLGKVGTNDYDLSHWQHVWCVRPKKQ